MREVTIIQRLLPHYRVDFFEGLYKALARENIQLNLIYGKPNSKEALKKDNADIRWAIEIKNKTIKLGPLSFYWQPCFKYIRNSELIIIEQANKNLINYLFFLQRSLRKRKIAFWGHGLNHQSNKGSISNTFKRKLIASSDWWFAYTSSVKEFLLENNYPEQQITTVQNAINTSEIIKESKNLSPEDILALKTNLNISSDNIGIYCGGIYNEKRIPFLIEASRKIKEKVQDFHLIIVGSGPDVAILKELIKESKWIHFLGPKFGKDKASLLKLAKVFLMPGLVGLAILDAFASKTPLITTNYPFHSPEIEYLQSGENGIISENDILSYTSEVVKVLQDDSLLDRLMSGCEKATAKYTLETMICNFKEGIVKCLNSNI